MQIKTYPMSEGNVYCVYLVKCHTFNSSLPVMVAIAYYVHWLVAKSIVYYLSSIVSGGNF